MEVVIKELFRRGLQEKEIRAHLKKLGKTLSRSTLQRKLKELGLFRRKNFSDVDEVKNFISEEIAKAGRLVGYKWMHQRCIHNNFVVSRTTVYEIMKEVDPLGLQRRKKNRLQRRVYSVKGPNWLWHVDSYDKLKPFGININGCIDGFSRYMIWLRAGSTSSDPKVIGSYYIDACEIRRGIPNTIRSDLGTENYSIRKLQTSLKIKYKENSQSPAFLMGKSTHNQRIESWWGELNTHWAQFYRDTFLTLKEEGLFDGTELDTALIRFLFIDLVQKELDDFVEEWNSHIIRKSKSAVAPGGRPLNLYFLPEKYDAEEGLIEVTDHEDFSICKRECRYLNGASEIDNELMEIMDNNNFSKSEDPNETMQLYCELREILTQ